MCVYVCVRVSITCVSYDLQNFEKHYIMFQNSFSASLFSLSLLFTHNIFSPTLFHSLRLNSLFVYAYAF